MKNYHFELALTTDVKANSEKEAREIASQRLCEVEDILASYFGAVVDIKLFNPISLRWQEHIDEK